MTASPCHHLYSRQLLSTPMTSFFLSPRSSVLPTKAYPNWMINADLVILPSVSTDEWMPLLEKKVFQVADSSLNENLKVMTSISSLPSFSRCCLAKL